MDRNIVLIGMTGAGKTTVGKRLSDIRGINFYDLDELISLEAKLVPGEIVKNFGLEYFLELQDRIVNDLNVGKSVISTGGSVIKSGAAMLKLKSIGIIIYLNVDFNILEQRLDKSRPLAKNAEKSFYDLFCERESLYIKYADIILDCKDKTVDEIVGELKIIAI